MVSDAGSLGPNEGMGDDTLTPILMDVDMSRRSLHHEESSTSLKDLDQDMLGHVAVDINSDGDDDEDDENDNGVSDEDGHSREEEEGEEEEEGNEESKDEEDGDDGTIVVIDDTDGLKLGTLSYLEMDMGSSNNKKDDMSCLSGEKTKVLSVLGHVEECLPLWVKWRGKWQAGIQCNLDDCPTLTLKAMPTSGRKTYNVVYFPSSKSYVWVDGQYVCAISQNPEPLAFGTHESGRCSVSDLGVVRQFMIRSIVSTMLDISDRLPIQVVVHCAREVSFWKDFAMEAAKSTSYSELGVMLVQLKEMILPKYFKKAWVKTCFDKWKHQSSCTKTAGSLESLVKDLKNAINWNVVEKIWDSPEQANLESEWKSLKVEVERESLRASRSRRLSSLSNNCNTPLPHSSNSAEESGGKTLRERETSDVKRLSKTDLMHKSRNGPSRCLAYSERRKRQCNKIVGGTSLYCYKHRPLLDSSDACKKIKSVDIIVSPPNIDDSGRPICSGMTTYGRQCTHRSQKGSTFCKKHLLQEDMDSDNKARIVNTNFDSQSSEHAAKRKKMDTNVVSSSSRKRKHMEFLGNKDEFSADSSRGKSSSRSSWTRCIGWCKGSGGQCSNRAKSGASHCEKHVPNSLSYPDSQKSPNEGSVSEDRIIERASDLLHEYMTACFPDGASMDSGKSRQEAKEWILVEASKDIKAAEILFDLVTTEKERLETVIGKETAEENKKSIVCTRHMRVAGVESSLPNNSSAVEEGASSLSIKKEMSVAEVLESTKCSSCEQTFGSQSELHHHQDRTHKQLIVAEEEAMQTDCARKSILSCGTFKYTCKYCGQKFRLLPELGRHHQAQHRLQQMKTDPSDKSNMASSSVTVRKKRLQKLHVRRGKSQNAKSKSRINRGSHQNGYILDPSVEELDDYQGPKIPGCPSNKDILAIARLVCCKNRLYSILQKKYEIVPDRLSAKSAKLCIEANVRLQWHREGFICPIGCKEVLDSTDVNSLILSPSSPRASFTCLQITAQSSEPVCSEVIPSVDDDSLYKTALATDKSLNKVVVLCKDVSFGQEKVPIPCIIDGDIAETMDILTTSRPWDSFSYVTKRLLDPSLGLDTESSQVGCTCPESQCSPKRCEHVYLFDNDNNDARDIYGRSMCRRFPYDSNGSIILEEGYLVYECNSLCNCQEECRNRVLQKGVRVKLEVYKTGYKGWAVRAAQSIKRGTFVCEYIGEVLDDREANRRGERYDKEGCSYLYDIDAHIDARFLGRKKPFVIDATKYGNVARFINHSCSPNLVNYQVLVESMDCQLAHIGLYASRNIALGEELAYDYRYKLLPGKGCPCHCGAKNCRGRLY